MYHCAHKGRASRYESTDSFFNALAFPVNWNGSIACTKDALSSALKQVHEAFEDLDNSVTRAELQIRDIQYEAIIHRKNKESESAAKISDQRRLCDEAQNLARERKNGLNEAEKEGSEALALVKKTHDATLASAGMGLGVALLTTCVRFGSTTLKHCIRRVFFQGPGRSRVHGWPCLILWNHGREQR